jgi:hypothetical protein
MSSIFIGTGLWLYFPDRRALASRGTAVKPCSLIGSTMLVDSSEVSESNKASVAGLCFSEMRSVKCFGFEEKE